MKKDDSLFDDKIRKKLIEEIKYVPSDINKKIDEAIGKANKKRFSKRAISSICAASLVGVMLFGITMPTYAKNIPIIGSIFEKFELKRYENYDKYALDLNLTKESNGVSMTINKVVYDGIDLSLIFTLENLPEDKVIDLTYDMKINGKETSFGSAQGGRYINGKKTFIGDLQFSVNTKSSIPKEGIKKVSYGGDVEIPEKFTLTLDIRSGNKGSKENIIKGQWNFDIPVSSEKVEGKVMEENINIDLSNICKNTTINKITITPINTVIETVKEDNGFNLSYILFDDKGRYIEPKGMNGMGVADENNEYKFYETANFKEIYEDTESLIFIPYKDIILENINSNINEENHIEVSELKLETLPIVEKKLNLEGQTSINNKNGEEYVTITKVEVDDDKTKVYFISEYSIYGAPFEITDDSSGEKIKPINEGYPKEFLENTTYLKDTEEYVVTFDKSLNLSNNYSIKCYDNSNKIKVYNDESFILNVSK